MNPAISIPEGVHAILSASKSAQWINCVGSLGATRGIPGRPATKFAAEGTVYHDVARRALTEKKDCGAYVGDRYEVNGFSFTVDAANAAYAQEYVGSVRAIPGKHFVEVDLDYSKLLGLPKYAVVGPNTARTYVEGESLAPDEHRVPVAAGTADFVSVDYENEIVHVGDLKFGRGDIVYAEGNSQMRLYAAAAVARYALLGIEDHWKVKPAIYQPRVYHYDAEELTVGELRAWTESTKPVANRVYTLWAFGRERVEVSDLTPGDKQCRWCPLAGQCEAQTDKMLGKFPKGHAKAAIPGIAQISDEELSEHLDLVDEVENWISAVRAAGLARAQGGNVIPNYKLTEGRRGNRSMEGDARIKLSREAAIEIGLEEIEAEGADLTIKDAVHFALGDGAYKPRDLKTVAQLQKLLEKNTPLFWVELQDKITQADGKPTLVRIEDPRAPIAVSGPEFPLVAETH